MTESAATEGDGSSGEHTDDDVRRKFREALERKQQNAKAKSRGAHEDGGAYPGHSHGPAPHKRTFRRKSG